MGGTGLLTRHSDCGTPGGISLRCLWLSRKGPRSSLLPRSGKVGHGWVRWGHPAGSWTACPRHIARKAALWGTHLAQSG